MHERLLPLSPPQPRGTSSKSCTRADLPPAGASAGLAAESSAQRVLAAGLQKAICLLTALSHLLLCQSTTSATLQQLQQPPDCHFLTGWVHGSGNGQVILELAEERAGPHSRETREGLARLERKGNKTPLLGLLSSQLPVKWQLKQMPVCVRAPVTAAAGGQADAGFEGTSAGSGQLIPTLRLTASSALPSRFLEDFSKRHRRHAPEAKHDKAVGHGEQEKRSLLS